MGRYCEKICSRGNCPNSNNPTKVSKKTIKCPKCGGKLQRIVRGR